MSDRQPSPATAPHGPIGRVVMWTLPWVALIVVLLVLGSFTKVQISYGVYTWARRVAAVVLIVLAIAGLLYALDLVGDGKDQPWFTIGLLVALVLFWGLFPPAWFFTEYYLLDQGRLDLPDEIQRTIDAAADENAKSLLRAPYLAATKTYADLASKIWVSVGAAMATAIGFAKRP